MANAMELSYVIQVPLSQVGDAAAFSATVEAFRAALAAHRIGPHQVAAPVAHPLVEALVACVPRGDPLPDAFQVLPYEIVDDTPRSAEQQTALDVLRETLG